MINIVLMAGKGQRFAEAGYKQSKPLIPVSGKPMIIRAVESMPKSDKWIFVVRQDHLAEQEVISTLKSVSKDVTVLVDKNPTGQLNSCLVAKEYYDNDEPMFVGACDFGMVFDREKFNRLITANQADMVVFSFTGQPNLTRNPQAWGWLKQDGQMNISGVSVKVPISDNPFNDYAITGSFAFKSGKYFLQLAEELIKRDIKVKGEYYIDSMIALACELGHKVLSFPVKYIGWGVPPDYEEYVWWEKAISQNLAEAKVRPEYNFWADYFNYRTYAPPPFEPAEPVP